jgi:hypothetical protein
VPLIYFFYPETKNLSLEKIDRLFTGEKVQMKWQPWMEDNDMSQVRSEHGKSSREKADVDA